MSQRSLNKLSLFLSAFFLMAVCGRARANSFQVGGGSTGGGKGVVCRDSANKVISVELLDLWEARTLYGRKIQLSDLPLDSQVDRALMTLKYAYAVSSPLVAPWNQSDEKAAALFLDTLRSDAQPFLDPGSDAVLRLRGVDLTRVDDAAEIASPEDCKLEQLVRYQDLPSVVHIEINQDLVDKMDITNQAALIAHEVFYRWLRLSGDPNSLRSRRSVGFIFSGGLFPSLGSILPKKFIECTTTASSPAQSTVYMFDSSKPGEKRSFSYLATLLNGSPSIGYFEPAEENHTWSAMEESLYEAKPCAGSGMQVFYTYPGGPADVDRIAAVMISCSKSRKFMVSIVPQVIPNLKFQDSGIRKMTCRLIGK